MHKTIYIDIDEEIIGIISKIKKEDSKELFLVVPKNSLLTQGIINLKLLKKEVTKMGKKIILVTSDQHSKKIIKRVGLETKSKSVQDFINNKDFTAHNHVASEENLLEKPKKREIGSSRFYKSNEEVSFDSKKTQLIEENTQKIEVKTPNTFGNEYIKNNENREGIKNINKEIDNNTKKQNKIFRPNSTFKKSKKFQPKEILDDFYQNNNFKNKLAKDLEDSTNKKDSSIPTKKRLLIFMFIIILGLIIILSYWIYSNWPKMNIELFLKEETFETTLDLTVCSQKTAEDDCLEGVYREFSIEISEQFDASGEKFSNDKGMARGIVKIYNDYSSNKQPLVATTRLLSKEGKLFRLVEGVTVPGKVDDEPGMIEAKIIADEIGQDYNLEKTEFTIEGFKGSTKYDKFKVVSETPTTGGTNDNENKKVKIVTEQDINTAREKTIESFNNKLEENIEKELENENMFILTSIEKEIVSSDSSYAPDDITDIFNYTVKENIKLISFNKEAFEEKITASFKEEDLESMELERLNKIVFEKDVADYEKKELDLSISASAIYWPILNELEIKNNLVNKNNEEIKKYLIDINKIKKALITYSPSWLSTLPIKNKNLTINQSK